MSRTSQQRLTDEFSGIKIEVRGLTETLRRLSKAGADAEDMRELMHSTGEIVAGAARRHIPYRSGALASSVRAGRGKTKAVIRAGGARVPYAGVQHYGWPARNIDGHMFMVKGLNDARGQAVTHLEQGLRDLLRKNALV